MAMPIDLPSDQRIEEQIEFIEAYDEDQIIIENFQMRVIASNLWTLTRSECLDDVIINFYLQMISERSLNSIGYPKVYCFNSLMFSRIKNKLNEQKFKKELSEWTNHIDIFEFDFLFFPHHIDGNHWALTVADVKEQTIVYYDSMHLWGAKEMEMVNDYLQLEHADKKNKEMSGLWNRKNAKQFMHVPKQQNDIDCGVYMLLFAERISRRVTEMDFKQVRCFTTF